MLFLKSVLLGLSWGLLQGMIMFPQGIRNHAAFGWYHTFFLAMMLAFASLFLDMKKQWRNILLLLGCLILVWEFSEIGYSIARYDIKSLYEHIVFLDLISWHLTGFNVALLHFGRLLISIILIWRYK